MLDIYKNKQLTVGFFLFMHTKSSDSFLLHTHSCSNIHYDKHSKTVNSRILLCKEGYNVVNGPKGLVMM